MSGLFGTFNIAKRGMFTQQKAIDVTSHNIANANTEGYTRQRAVIETTRPAYMPSLNNSMGPGQSGTGSQVSVIERVRDSFMDFQVRNETSTYGQYEARASFLNEVESIFNEPSDTGLSTLVGKFFDSWQQLSKQAQSSNARTVVIQQSAALADELNHTYKQLEALKNNVFEVTKNTVFEISNMLTQVDQLNQQIMGVKIAGNNPNDLMDKRDLLLDKLSAKFNITVDRKGFEGIDVGTEEFDGTSKSAISKLIEAGNGGNTAVPKNLAYISSIDEIPDDPDIPVDPENPTPKTYKITYYKSGSITEENKGELIVTGLTDEMKDKLLQSGVLLVNSKGEPINQNGEKLTDGIEILPNGEDATGNSIYLSELLKAGIAGSPKMFSYISDISLDPSETTSEDSADGDTELSYIITYYKKGDMASENNKVQLKVNLTKETKNQLLQSRVLLANSDGLAIRDDGTIIPFGASMTASDIKFQPISGELKGYSSVAKDIDDYMGQLNKLAKAIAFSVNAVHSGDVNATDDYMPFFVNSSVATYDNKNLMIDRPGIVAAENQITAGNISVNKELIYDVMKLKTRTHDDIYPQADQNVIDGETDGARAAAIAGLRDTLMNIQNIGDSTSRASFIGTSLKPNGLGITSNTSGMKIDNYFRDTVDRLGVQTQESKRMVKNQESLLNSFEETRLSISGVSLDEEMANLVQFQHAYQANAKIIATVDELLDVVVNGLKR